METINQRKNALLRLSIVLIISGTIFDSFDIFATMLFDDTYLKIHLFLKDLMFVGFALGFFLQTDYKKLQLKAFTFMLVVWRSIVALFNVIGYYEPKVIIALYLIFFFWLFKTLSMKEIPNNYEGKTPSRRTYTYNIFIPVHSFRGLLKSLIPIFSDPRYETTIFVCGNTMHYVKNKRFHEEVKDEKIIQALINKTNAKVTLGNATPRQIKAIKRLSTKTAITGLRDCGKLRI